MAPLSMCKHRRCLADRAAYRIAAAEDQQSLVMHGESQPVADPLLEQCGLNASVGAVAGVSVRYETV